MKAAVVFEAGATPVHADFGDPVGTGGKELIRVTASALSHVVRSRASGGHYSSKAGLPFVVGVDGVGIRERDGCRVYFLMPQAPFGSMAERTLVDADRVIELPDDLDSVTAAAMAIPGMSSWVALTERARLVPGETVLVNGATGASGRLAVQVAKRLGAGKVIATGRNRQALDEIAAIGGTETIALERATTAIDEDLQRTFRNGVDVVLDYLWGSSAEATLAAAATSGPDGVPIRYVAIGAAAGETIPLRSAVLRSSSIEMLGSGINSVSLQRILESIGELFAAAGPGAFEIATRPLPLATVADAWAAPGRDRIVFTMQPR